MKIRITAALLFGMAAALAQASDVRFTQLEEKIEDTPIKVNIEQIVLVEGQPTAGQIRTELNRRYQLVRERAGFRHHRNATNIYIYIYGSREQARAGQGLWVGMVSWTIHSGGAPDIRIDEGRLAAMGAEPEERFGFSEKQRRQIFRDVVLAEDRARNEAMRRIPDTRWEEQLDLEDELGTRYRTEVLKRWGITDQQARQISIEAMSKGWPLP